MPSNGWRRCVNAALAALVVAASTLPAQGAPRRTTYEELNNFSGVLNFVRLNYPDTVSFSDLVAAAIRGMLAELDPHSHYFSRVEWERHNALERGELATTGIRLESVEGVPTVLAVYPRSPAAKAGVQPGDRLLALNDTATAGLDVGALELRLAGEKGSRVRVRFERGPKLEPDTFSVRLKRDIFEIRSVSTVRLVAPAIGLVRLEEFGPTAAKEVHDALRKLRGQGARQYILDLRGNPGGFVIAAVEIAAEFFPKGTAVFRTAGRKKDIDTTYVTATKGDFAEVPLVVLIDGGSASAAEALAGSLQDHDRAVLVGRRSFGKALMQIDHYLPSGDVVTLTIGRVYTPNGRFIQRRYRGLAYEQYLSFAGKSGAEADTLAIYKTDRGRPVRGGGGIVPDVALLEAALPPRWWVAAAVDSAFDDAVADSVAAGLPTTPAARQAWIASSADWKSKLLPSFLDRVRTRLGVSTPPDSGQERRIVAILAARVAEVRWGADAREELLLSVDGGVRAAIAQFPRLAALLGPPTSPN